MDKNFIYAELNAVYGQLLTEKQRDITDLYYSQDLSLGEISEIKKVTRQSVLDTLEKSRQSLSFYEETLGVYAKRLKFLDLAQRVSKDDSSLGEEIIRILEDN